MKKRIAIFYRLTLFLFLFLNAGSLFAQHYKKDGTPDRRYKENRSTPYHSSSSHSSSHSTPHYTNSSTATRDSHGRIKRNSAAKHAFMKQTGYPKGRKGYVVDHIKPLKEGGCDCPENMQWQTIEDGKAKDKWE